MPDELVQKTEDQVPKRVRRAHPAADVGETSDVTAITVKSEWFLFLRQVPVWERERIAEEIRSIDIASHDGFRKLQQLLIAEVAAGNIPASFTKEIDPLMKNIFASITVERAESDREKASPLHTLIEKFSVERRSIAPVTPSYAVIEAEKEKVSG